MANSKIKTSFQNLVNVIKEKTFSATDGATLQATVADMQIDITDLGISKIGISQIGMANGVAGLDENGIIPDIELPIDLIHTSQIGMANGVASLDSTGKVPSSQIPGEESTEYHYTVITKTTGGTDATITVSKYINDVLESSKDYKYSSLSSAVNIDGRFTLIYGSSRYTMTLLQASEDHTAGYSTSWLYSETVNISEIFNVSNGDLAYIADPFSTVVSYAVGDLVIYEGLLRKCIAPHSAGTWNADHFTETTVDDAFMKPSRDYVVAGRKANTTAGTKSTAEGTSTTSSGSNSHAEGYNTNALNSASHAEGSGTSASGGNSHSEGQSTQATATSAHAEGSATTASGNSSHAEGTSTIASKSSAHAEGISSNAAHQGSHAEGNNTQTGNNYQHVQGKFNVGKSTTAFEIGNGSNTSNRSNAVEVDWSGNATFAGDVTATVDNVTIALSDAQLQNLSSAITIGGTSCTTVEDSIEALNDTKVSKTGDTLTGPLIVTGNPILVFEDSREVIPDNFTIEIGSSAAFCAISYSNIFAEMCELEAGATGAFAVVMDLNGGIIGTAYVTVNETKNIAISEFGTYIFRVYSVSSEPSVISADIVDGSGNILRNKLNSSDISSWAKASTKPSYGISEITGITAQTTDPGAGSALTTGNIIFVYDA